MDSRKPNPGPPLTSGDEFCACQTPSGMEYLKASAAALLVLLLGAGAITGTALLSGQIWSVLSALIGAGLGLAVNWAAGRHRSVWLGVIAAGGTGLATGIAYAGLLLIGRQIVWGVPWTHLLMIVAGGLLAYRFAGPNSLSRKGL